jgi:uncharacterized membrane protein
MSENRAETGQKLCKTARKAGKPANALPVTPITANRSGNGDGGGSCRTPVTAQRSLSPFVDSP